MADSNQFSLIRESHRSNHNPDGQILAERLILDQAHEQELQRAQARGPSRRSSKRPTNAGDRRQRETVDSSLARRFRISSVRNVKGRATKSLKAEQYKVLTSPSAPLPKEQMPKESFKTRPWLRLLTSLALWGHIFYGITASAKNLLKVSDPSSSPLKEPERLRPNSAEPIRQSLH
ncbi:hypothetical protein OUZ56_028007 [Daphnia magna]|uniref:Uncharacterized protein n=1 Tax=Daphnia magna TaxID=35525 RepID=A0ABR0B2K3_9CRUS|nr:hypothetical protein OUZ56_028007 [Daphnia magna]